MSIQGIILVLLGGAGLLGAMLTTDGSPEATFGVLFFQLNWPYSLLLLGVGVLSLLAAHFYHSLVWWSGAQFVGFAILYWFGTAADVPETANNTPFLLGTPEAVLHLVLTLNALVVLMMTPTLGYLNARRHAAQHLNQG